MSRNKVSRRDLLKTAMASAACFVPARVLGREGPPPSERVNIGIIGLG